MPEERWCRQGASSVDGGCFGTRGSGGGCAVVDAPGLSTGWSAGSVGRERRPHRGSSNVTSRPQHHIPVVVHWESQMLDVPVVQLARILRLEEHPADPCHLRHRNLSENDRRRLPLRGSGRDRGVMPTARTGRTAPMMPSRTARGRRPTRSGSQRVLHCLVRHRVLPSLGVRARAGCRRRVLG